MFHSGREISNLVYYSVLDDRSSYFECSCSVTYSGDARGRMPSFAIANFRSFHFRFGSVSSFLFFFIYYLVLGL